ncbi:hypothetical protein GCM10027598_80530 [Amycolatopsis oliviviridis]|uniref:Guanylate cyclase domain-containing protein n=1 Tax=Amycolatopsis oliviviridis TaxID=1471590 RepID=A0ABQ3LBN0_9PSEU|nr:hypothetical protein [Amycolatopsis oliviviridis]GHH05875.1 hypothetical protein GCM10017790_10440 [Amycolatopsis oliviviridis]
MELKTAMIRPAAALAALTPHLRHRWRCRRRDPQHRSIIVIDLVAFGARGDLAQLTAREDLDTVVNAALRASGLSRARLRFEDRGDGMLIFVSPVVSKAMLIDPFVPALRTRLHAHNTAAPAERRIRVRVAIHAGEVVQGPHGWIGTELNLACRLVDAAVVREEFAHQPQADLVVAISDVIHRAVVRHGHRGTDVASYKGVRVATKEVITRAWIHSPRDSAWKFVSSSSTTG